MQRNIATKFAGYVASILLCEHCKFGDKIFYNSRDIEFFLWDYFLLASRVGLHSGATPKSLGGPNLRPTTDVLQAIYAGAD